LPAQIVEALKDSDGVVNFLLDRGEPKVREHDDGVLFAQHTFAWAASAARVGDEVE
jgi:hypothetical protein